MKILHLIDSLDYGGAETLLTSYLPLLNDVEHIVVTLNGPNVYTVTNWDYRQLSIKTKKQFFQAVILIRKIIKQERVDIVHAHSYLTNIISRFACPDHVKLFNHYHFADYDTMKSKRSVKGMILIDRLTAKRKLTRIAVSAYVAKILSENFPKTAIEVVPNFITATPLTQPDRQSRSSNTLQVVAVGNCNLEKNYDFLIRVFKALESAPITLDIYGGGPKLAFYRKQVATLGLTNVRFCGPDSDIRMKLPTYDLFLSASTSETFGIVVLESVAAKLPLLLSNIPAFREIAPNGSEFFNPTDENDLHRKLLQFINEPKNIDVSSYKQVMNRYSDTNFIRNLREVYNKYLCVE